jgi:hypothetical protein
MEFTKKQIFEEFHVKSYKQMSRKQFTTTSLAFIRDTIEIDLTEEGQREVATKMKTLLSKYMKELAKSDGTIKKLQQKPDWNEICLTVKLEWLNQRQLYVQQKAIKLAESVGNDIDLLIEATRFAAERNNNNSLRQCMEILEIIRDLDVV